MSERRAGAAPRTGEAIDGLGSTATQSMRSVMMGPRPATGAGRVSLAAGAVGLFGLLAAVVVAPAPAESASGWEDVETPFAGWAGPVALDHGQPRFLYGDGEGGLVFAWCDGGCGERSSWQSVELIDGASLAGFDLAIDRWGRPHIAYLDEAREGIFYAACDEDCHRASSWTHTKVDTTTDDEGLSLALDPWGRPRLAYVAFQGNGTETKYARCNDHCTTDNSWGTLTLPVDGGDPSLDLAGTKPRIAYETSASARGFNLRYLACDSGCLDERSWSSTTVAWFDSIGQPSLVVEGESAHVAFNPIGSAATSLAYTRCESGCSEEGRWSDPVLITPGERAIGPSLAVTEGRPRIAYMYCEHCFSPAQQTRVQFARCDAGCGSRDEWSITDLAEGGKDGYLALDGERPRVVYQMGSPPEAGGLHYAFCDAPCGQAGSWPAPPSEPPPEDDEGEPSSSTTTSTSPSGGGSGDGDGSGGGAGGGGWAGGGDDSGGGSSPAGSDDPGSPGGGDASSGEGDSSDGGDAGGVDGLGGSGGGGDSGSGGSGGAGAVSGGVGSDGAQVDGGDGVGDGSGGGASVGGVARGVGRAPGAAVDLVANPSQALSWPWARIAVSTLAAVLLAVCGWMVWVVGAARPGPRRPGGAPR